MHTFIKTRQDDGQYLYSVGSWTPPAYGDTMGKWNPLRDCDSPYKAAMWVNWFNGGAERPVDFLESWT